MSLTFAVDVPTPYVAPEHRKALGMRPAGVAHRMWATVPRDRSRVGQRGSQSRGAEGERCQWQRERAHREVRPGLFAEQEAQRKGAASGARFFRPFLCAFKERDPGARGTESPQEAVNSALVERSTYNTPTGNCIVTQCRLPYW